MYLNFSSIKYLFLIKFILIIIILEKGTLIRKEIQRAKLGCLPVTYLYKQLCSFYY